FGDDQIGERLEVPDDREAVLRAGRHREEDRDVKPAAPKLLLPGVERHILCRKVLTEARRPGFPGIPEPRRRPAKPPPPPPDQPCPAREIHLRLPPGRTDRAAAGRSVCPRARNGSRHSVKCGAEQTDEGFSR